ncbi:MAG: ABC transporter substrate-binding protein [Deltaproteobacteria bacterium]|nr:ABC transporter substrate-binding protein [Deltaproteobacteria bacterium]
MLLRSFVIVALGVAGLGADVAAAAPLRVGVTLHPYHSWVHNVVQGTDVVVVPVLPGDVDVDAYQPRADDIAILASLDVLVRNGLGHDAVADAMVAAANNPRLLVVDINAETATLPAAHGKGKGKGKNSHTFLSLTNAVQQSALLARVLGQRLAQGGAPPAVAAKLQDNAAAYGKRLRRLLADAQARLKAAPVRRVIAVHDGYGYLLQELGIELVTVVEPAHGLLPSAAELGDVVALVKREGIRVVLAEEQFPAALARPLEQAGAKTFVVSHVATGAFAADRFEREMKRNLDTLVVALGGR